MQILRITPCIDLINGPLFVEEGGYTPSVGSHPFDRVTETINAYFATDDPAAMNNVLRKLDEVAYKAKKFAEYNGEVYAPQYLEAKTENGDFARAPITGLSWAWRSPLGTGDEFSNRRAIVIRIERIAGWRVSTGDVSAAATGHGSAALLKLFNDDEVGTSKVFDRLEIHLTNSHVTTRPTILILSSLHGDSPTDIWDYSAPCRAKSDATNVEDVAADNLPFYPTDVSPDADDKCAVLLNGDEVEGEIVAYGNQSFYSRPVDHYLVVVRAILTTKSGGSSEERGDPLLTVLLSLYPEQDAATDNTVQIVGSFSPTYDRTIYPVGTVSIPRVADQPVELIDRLLIRLDYLGSVATKYNLYLDTILLVPLDGGNLIITEPASLAWGGRIYAFRNEAGLIHVAAPVQRSHLQSSWLPFDADIDALMHRKQSLFIIGELSYYDTNSGEWKAPEVACYLSYTKLSLDLLQEEP